MKTSRIYLFFSLALLVSIPLATAALPSNDDVFMAISFNAAATQDDATNASQGGPQTVTEDGTVTAGAHLGANSHDFDGGASNADHVNTNHTPAYNTAWSACGWFYNDNEPQTQWLFSTGGEGGGNTGGPSLAYLGASNEWKVYQGAGTSSTLVTTVMPSTTWIFVCLTYDGNVNSAGDANDINLYLNGTQMGNVEHTTSSSPKAFQIGTYHPSNDYSGWYGRIDELIFFDVELTSAEVLSLYNSPGSGYAYPYIAATPPTVTVYGPEEGVLTDNTTVRFTYTADEDNDLNMNVTLIINGTDNVTAEIANTTAYHEINESFVEGEYQFIIQVVDSAGEGTNSSDYNFTVDFTQPAQSSGAGNNVSLSNTTQWNIHRDGDEIVINFNTTDDNLFRVDFNLTSPNGSVEFSHTANDLNVTEYNVSVSPILNLSTPGAGYVGQFNISFLSADGHTAKYIDPLPYTVTSNSVTFTYPSGVTCTFESEESNLAGLEIWHEGDRMRFTVQTNSAKLEHGFNLDCSEPIIDRSHRHPFPSFVIWPAWFDLAVEGTQPGEYVIKRLSETKINAKLKYSSPADEISFSSTGLVNINAQTYNFNNSKTPFAPSSSSVDDVDITWIFHNWTAGTGANLYEVTRDGVNIANTTNIYYNHTGLSGGTSYTVGARSVYNDSETYYVNTTLVTDVQQTIFNGTLSVEVRNEVTNDVITGPLVFINLLGNTVNVTGNTTTGVIGLVNISSDNYTIRHSSIGWGSRDQYLEIGENDSGSIIVYLINDTIRDPGRVFVRDTQSDPVNGTILKLLRYFDDENLYRVVEMSTTNDEGVAVMAAQANDAFYKWFVEYGGETKISITIPEFLSLDDDNLWRRSFTINIGRDFWESYRSETNDVNTVTFTNATRTLSYTFNDPDGIVTRGCIRARWANGTRWTTVGPACVAASSGVALLTLPSNDATYFWTSYVDTNTLYTEEVETGSGTVDGNRFDGFRTPGVRFLAVILYLGAVALFAFNAIIGSIVAGVLFAVLSFLQAFPFSMGTAMAALTITIGMAVYTMRRSG